eukprot:9029343-Prorocentrum_lima.AAC.1
MFAVLESVARFNARQKAPGVTPAVEVRRKFEELLGSARSGWEIDFLPYNTFDYGLLHSRPRVFICFVSSPGLLPPWPHA